MHRTGLATALLVWSRAAVAGPDLSVIPSATVVAESSVALDTSAVEISTDCAFYQFFGPPPHAGVEFTWDMDVDGVYEVPWLLTTSTLYTAAGVDGPDEVRVGVGGRCYTKNWWDAFGDWVWDEGFDDVRVEVLNADPVAGLVSARGYGASIPRATSVTFDVEARDPEAADTLQATWRWSDGSVQTGLSVTRSFAAASNVTVRVEVEDDDGGEAVAGGAFVVGNDPPTIVAFGVPTLGTEGVSVGFTGRATDPVDPLTFGWTVLTSAGVEVARIAGQTVTWTPPDDDVYTVTMSVSDGVQTVTQSGTISVGNLDPVVYAVTPPTPLYEGVAGTFEVAAGDVAADPLSARWDFGGGFGALGPLAVAQAFPDDGSYSVSVEVDDGDGGTASATQTVAVANLAPVPLTVQVPGTAEEGQVIRLYAQSSDVPADTVITTWEVDGVPYGGEEVFVTLPVGVHLVWLTLSDGQDAWQGRFDIQVTNRPPVVQPVQIVAAPVEGVAVDLSVDATDPGGGPVTAEWSFGDGGTAVGLDVTHAWADDGSYTGTVVVRDGGGGVTTTGFSVDVANLDPTLVTAAEVTSPEGAVASLSAAVSDVPADAVTVSWWLDGVWVATGPTWSSTFPDDAVRSVRVRADDGDGGVVEQDVALTVSNVAPSVVLLGDTDDSGGAMLTWTALVTDPGADTFRFDWDFDDGTTLPDGGQSASHVFATNGRYDVRVTVTDDDGGVGDAVMEVQIGEIGPQIVSLGLPDEADEGTSTILTCDADDLGGAGGITYAWDFGDGAGGAGSPVSHAWPDDGDRYVRCIATDALGRQDTDGALVRVVNVAPTLAGTPPTSLAEGDPLSWTPTLTDPGADTFSFIVTGPPGVAVSVGGTVTWTAPVGGIGRYEFELEARDDDGGVDRVTWEVEVGLRDADGDGMGDYWELDYGLDPTDPADAALDGDGDGRDNLNEFVLGTDPWVDDRPPAPVLVSPVGGEEVTTDSPWLLAAAVESPVGDPILYEVEVFRDESLTDVVSTWTDPGGPAGVAVQAAGLAENKAFWWTARARDTFAGGPWAAAESFFVNTVEEPPAAPVLDWPVDGATVSTLNPTLSWRAAADPEGGPVRYTLFVEDLVGGAVASVPGLTGGDPVTWTTSTLADGQVVRWWVVAVDRHGLQGPASEGWTFEVDLSNLPPSEPVIVSPADGSVVPDALPMVVVDNGVDPEGRDTWLRWELGPPGGPVEQEGLEAADPSGQSAWWPEALVEDRAYELRVLASDGAADSAWVVSLFTVNAVNNPPAVPVLVTPQDGAVRTDGELGWRPSVDPEGDAVSYDVVVQDAGGVVRAQAVAVQAVGPRVTWTPAPLAPGAYTWRVRAVDDLGAASEWTAAWGFTQGLGDVVNSREVPEVGGAVELLTGCGCDAGGAGGAWAALAASALLRRRRSGGQKAG